MLNSLRPETIVNNLVEHVEKTKDLKTVKKVLSNVFALVARSLSKYDYETAADGLKGVLKAVKLTDDPNFHFWVCCQIRRLEEQIIATGDEEVISNSIYVLTEIGKSGKTEDLRDLSIKLLNKFKSDCEKLGLNELAKTIDDYLKDLSKLDESRQSGQQFDEY